MFITNIKPGANTYNDYKGRLLYAEVRENDDSLVCFAALEFILQAFFDRQEKVSNYKEALFRYIDFNNEMIESIP